MLWRLIDKYLQSISVNVYFKYVVVTKLNKNALFHENLLNLF